MTWAFKWTQSSRWTCNYALRTRIVKWWTKSTWHVCKHVQPSALKISTRVLLCVARSIRSIRPLATARFPTVGSPTQRCWVQLANNGRDTPSLVGGAITILKNMSSSMGLGWHPIYEMEYQYISYYHIISYNQIIIIPTIGENNSHVPNHQPV